VISTFQCPSDLGGAIPNSADFAANFSGRAVCNYYGNCGQPASGSNPNCPCTNTYYTTYKPFTGTGGFTFPNGCSSASGCAKPNPAGLFSRTGNDFKCQFRQITDGLSKTIMVGETRPACSEYAQVGWAASDNLNGLSSPYIPLNYDSCIGGTNSAAAFAAAQAKGLDGCAASHNWSTSWGWKSRHPGVVNVIMADGAVLALSENIDQFTLARLGVRADGQTIGVFP